MIPPIIVTAEDMERTAYRLWPHGVTWPSRPATPEEKKRFEANIRAHGETQVTFGDWNEAEGRLEIVKVEHILP